MIYVIGFLIGIGTRAILDVNGLIGLAIGTVWTWWCLRD